MTSKLNIPKISKGNDMAEGIRSLIGKKLTKKVKFMGEDVSISKLSVAEVLEIQAKAKVIDPNSNESIELLRSVIRMAVEGADTLSDDDFNNFPMDELSKLSNEVMKFSGMLAEQTGK